MYRWLTWYVIEIKSQMTRERLEYLVNGTGNTDFP